MLIIKLFLTIIIIILAMYDVLYREIPVTLVVIGIFLGVITRLNMVYRLEINNIYEIYAVMPALIYIFIHWLSNKNIGLGDGLVLLMSELSMRMELSLISFAITSISSFIFAVTLIILRRRYVKIPFVVFIFLGHIYSFLKDSL